jgi:alanine-glyoxylate transaminase / serine-glyoxylate transaminase / serine-pyruvate transaminase
VNQEKLLLIPGPTPVHPRIINSLSLPTISHVSEIFISEFKEALSNLKKIVFCRSGEPFIIAGSGTVAMEMALLNTIGKGEKFLVLSQGYFGQRMAEIGKVFDLHCDIIQSEWGKAVLPEELEKKLSEDKYAAVFSTHVDTATGACAPVKEYTDITRPSDTLFILDGVCATGGIEENMDDWGIDVILTAAQKCFGVPPGLAVLVFSEKAVQKRRQLGSIPAYHSDILRWLPIMKDPSNYFSTPCVNEIRAFCEGTRIIIEEKLDVRFPRHRKTAKAIRAALSELGFSFFTEKEFLANTLSVVKYPSGIDDKVFRSEYFNNGIVVAGGLGKTAGSVFRMGHMGNVSGSQVLFAIEALEKTLDSMGYGFQLNSGVQAAKEILDSRLE